MSKYQNTYEDSYDYTPDCSTCYYYPLNFDDEPCSMCYPGNCFYTNTIPNAKNTIPNAKNTIPKKTIPKY